MWFGFWCGDGWFDAIWDLSQAVVDHAVPHGLDVVVTQVRERSHALLFRARGGDDTIGALVLEAELRCRMTCEQCGFDNRVRALHLGHDPRCTECGFALWEP